MNDKIKLSTLGIFVLFLVFSSSIYGYAADENAEKLKDGNVLEARLTQTELEKKASNATTGKEKEKEEVNETRIPVHVYGTDGTLHSLNGQLLDGSYLEGIELKGLLLPNKGFSIPQKLTIYQDGKILPTSSYVYDAEKGTLVFPEGVLHTAVDIYFQCPKINPAPEKKDLSVDASITPAVVKSVNSREYKPQSDTPVYVLQSSESKEILKEPLLIIASAVLGMAFSIFLWIVYDNQKRIKNSR